MVNVDFTLASFLGLLDVVLAIAYLISAIAVPIARRNAIGSSDMVLFFTQAAIVPFLLALAGGILVLQAWRLDPTLQFGISLLNGLTIYFAGKDLLRLRDR